MTHEMQKIGHIDELNFQLLIPQISDLQKVALIIS